MPIVSIAHKQSETRKAVSTQSGGCFGFMAGGGFFHGQYNDSKFVAYHLESKQQADRCEIVFADNALFPYHKFMTPNEWDAFLTENNFRDERRGTVSIHGYVVIEMQPEGYEQVGIPQDMFISGLFTARQLSHNQFDRWMDATTEDIHPMVAYALAELMMAADIHQHEGYMVRVQRQSSSNIDSTKFGIANLVNMIKYLRGDEDAIGYWGHEGGIIQRGRYKRDSQFLRGTEDFRTIWGWDSTLNMNSLIAPIDDDRPIINAGIFSPLYLQHVLNKEAGFEVLDVSNMKTNLTGERAVKGNDSYGMFNETRARFKKAYKVGQLVELRKDAVGLMTFAPAKLTQLISRAFQVHGNFNNNNSVTHPLVYGGVLPNRAVIEAIDKTRGEECIKLEMGTWVSPRMIKLVGVNEADGYVIEPEGNGSNRNITQNSIYQSANGTKALIRMYDMFDGEVRGIVLDDNWGVEERNFRPRDLTLVH